MTKSPLLLAYWALCLLHLLATVVEHEILILFTKPALMSLLGLWFYRAFPDKNQAFFSYILLGLVFSVAGDSLLMLVAYGPRQDHFFLLGLGAFLIAQLSYARAFWGLSRGRRGHLQVKVVRWLPLLLYWGGMLLLLLPAVAGEMRIPIAIYATAICAMVAGALNLYGLVPSAIFRALFTAVLLFLLSDSLIAVNKFLLPFPLSGLAIMSTYLVAQYGIARSAVALGNHFWLAPNTGTYVQEQKSRLS